MSNKLSKSTYENYPRWIVLLSNINTLAIYIIGAAIIFHIGLAWCIIYIIYILFLELKLLQKSCRNCYYYGKYCAFGKWKLSALLYPKGNPQKFLKKKITRKNLIPDALVSLIPIIIGIILLTYHFDRWITIGIVIIIALTTQGNNCIRGKLACTHCKQRELGCPASQLFDKIKK
jgi:hypothetical protein